MNKYLRAAYCVPCGFLKMLTLKITRSRHFSGPVISLVSPLSEITLDRGGELNIGTQFKMRDGAKIRVRSGAECRIGNNVSVSSNDIITCREKVIIGDNVQLSPNVLIYDHDHDYHAEGGIKTEKYLTSPIVIGDDVWIGANTVILRGTEIGDSCVIGAGSVLKGKYPPHSVVIQKRETQVSAIQ